MTTLSRQRSHGLDALRSLAILLVMLFHGQSFLPAVLQPVGRFGWMGVDLFFVLSGYLIAAQLLRQYARTGTIGWRAFYSRRALRVFPAYAVVLFAYVAYPAWREAPVMAPLWQYLSFTYNLFVRYPAQRSFSHVWSLCVEEQFYLVLPLLLTLLLRRPSARRATLAAAAIILAGIACRSWVFLHILRPLGPDDDTFASVYIERIYYPTWTRMDGLLAGVLLAAVERFRPATWNRLRQHGNVLATVGVLLVALCCRLFRDRFDAVDPVAATGTIVGFPLLATGIAALVVSSLGNGPLGRWRIPGATALATLAYSLYLTHKAVLHLCADHLPQRFSEGTWTGAAIFFGSSLATATALYFAVEKTCLRLRGSLRPEPLRDPAL